jgi:hypothetical protein
MRRPYQIRGTLVNMNPNERSNRARVAAFTMHSRHDVRETSKPGRDAFLKRFETEVDPQGRLEPEERMRRAVAARRAYFSKLGAKSARARQERRSA